MPTISYETSHAHKQVRVTVPETCNACGNTIVGAQFKATDNHYTVYHFCSEKCEEVYRKENLHRIHWKPGWKSAS